MAICIERLHWTPTVRTANDATGDGVSIDALVAEFAVTDWRASLNFYRDMLGFEIACDRPEEGFVVLNLGEA